MTISAGQPPAQNRRVLGGQERFLLVTSCVAWAWRACEVVPMRGALHIVSLERSRSVGDRLRTRGSGSNNSLKHFKRLRDHAQQYSTSSSLRYVYHRLSRTCHRCGHQQSFAKQYDRKLWRCAQLPSRLCSLLGGSRNRHQFPGNFTQQTPETLPSAPATLCLLNRQRFG